MADRRRVKRFEVYSVALDPTVGHEVRKTRPCVVISPNELNRQLATVIVAPLTSSERAYVSRVPCQLGDVRGQVMLDQLRTIDKTRLMALRGELDRATGETVLDTLQEMFRL